MHLSQAARDDAASVHHELSLSTTLTTTTFSASIAASIAATTVTSSVADRSIAACCAWAAAHCTRLLARSIRLEWYRRGHDHKLWQLGLHAGRIKCARCWCISRQNVRYELVLSAGCYTRRTGIYPHRHMELGRSLPLHRWTACLVAAIEVRRGAQVWPLQSTVSYRWYGHSIRLRLLLRRCGARASRDQSQ